MEAIVLTAPGDGVAPAVLLTLSGSGGGGGPHPALQKAQYLFGAPEGFSRLALEHRIRPGLHLRAVFAADVRQSLGGAGGLIMRLRGEGHGRLHVVGPPGTQAVLTSLRHFIRWRHPALLLCEATEWEQPVVYEDDCIAVAALWRPPLLAELWRPPPWLLAPAAPAAAAAQTAANEASSGRSSSSEEGSSEGSSSESDSDSDSEISDGSDSSAASSSSSDGSGEAAGRLQEQQQAQADSRQSAFEELDRLLMAGDGGGRRGSGRGRGRSAVCALGRGRGRGLGLARRGQVLQKLREAARAGGGAEPPGPAQQQPPAAAQPQAKRARTAAAAAAAAAAAPLPPAPRPATRAPTGEAELWDVDGKPYRQLPLPGISAFVAHKLSSAAMGPGQQARQALHGHQQQQREVLGFLCHLKSQDRLLLLTHLPTPAAATALARHPALPLLRAQAGRLAAALHSAAPGVPDSRAFQGLVRALQQQETAGGSSDLQQQQQQQQQQPPPPQQLLLEHPGQQEQQQRCRRAAGETPPRQQCQAACHLGHLATASTTARLNLVSPRLFPLPQPLAAGKAATAAAAGAPPDAPGGAGQAGRQGSADVAGSSGLTTVRCVSHLTWRQQEGGGPPLLEVRPAGAYADGCFDAAAKQQQVTEEHPELRRQLKLLHEQQADALPLLRAPPPAQVRCPPNTIAPPPPQPPQPAPVLPAMRLAMQARRGVQAPPPPPLQQPQGWQGRVMRPTYHQPQQPFPAALGSGWQPQLSPQPQQPQQQQQQQQPAQRDSNQGAAAALRARLKGGAVLPALPSDRQLEEEEEAAQPLPAWLRAAPPCLQGLARVAARAAASPCGGKADAAAAAAAAALGDGCPEVTFLGTGSAEPSKHRGASAIHLRLACGRGLLLDCGEGALGALARAFGAAGGRRAVAALAAAWVSHRHADHMGGLLALLAALPRGGPPLLLVGPASLRDWLAEAAPPAGLAGRYAFVHCSELRAPGHWAHAALCSALGLASIACVPVRHCSDAWALVLRAAAGWSLAYSGDTRPCPALAAAAAGATLLIHEATFEPCLAGQAALKRHSTTAEALEVARRAGAYRTILTHFSQRYPKWPEGLSEGEGTAPGGGGSSSGDAAAAGEAAGTAAGARPAGDPPDGGDGSMPAAAAAEVALAAGGVAVAFDGMRVPLALLPVLPALMPAVRAALADAGEEEENPDAPEEQQQRAEREEAQRDSSGTVVDA